MPFKSRWQIPIPEVSLPTFLFGPADSDDLNDSKAVLLDAEEPQYCLTLRAYREWAKRLAAGLQAAGFKQGDRVLLYSGNSIFFPVVLMGTIMAGGVFSGANPGYVPRELAYQLQDSGATFIITSDLSVDVALEAVDTNKFPRDRLFYMGPGKETFNKDTKPIKGVQHWTKLLASESQGASFRWEEFKSSKDMQRTCVLNYSSGTTGVPKGVEITHANYVANCQQTEVLTSKKNDYKEWLARAVHLGFLPMYHAYGQTTHCISVPRKLMPVYVMRKFDFTQFLEYVHKYRVTNLNIVPPVAVALTKRPEVRKYDLTCIEGASVGAAPLSPETARDFEKLFGNKFQLRQGWGMTEITCTAVVWHPEEESRADRVGTLISNVEAKFVDENDNEVGVNERGEFLVRGPNVMKGYWNKPEATKETITSDGWLRTGDIGFRDEKDQIAIVDRKKELIKVKGNQVAPAELEGVLLDNPSVVDAAVVGVTIDGEELPRAYVVVNDPKSKDAQPEAIAKWLESRVARHKRLLGGVKQVEAIPKNPSGKILRKILREQAKAEIGDKQAKL